MGEGGVTLEVMLMVALLPLTAAMLVLQSNPYHALVLRGILGAIAALVYAVLGAADVALTEALVGTMLAITLYAVAVRSSLVMRLGVLKTVATGPVLAVPFLEQLRQQMARYHVRLELVPYPTLESLGAALQAREIHGSCVLCAAPVPQEDSVPSPVVEAAQSETLSALVASPTLEMGPTTEIYQIVVRVQRLYDLLSAWLEQESLGAIATLRYLPAATPPPASPSVPYGSPAQEVQS